MKRMTKWLCCLLMLCLLISVLPITAHAASGKCGENVTWELNILGTLTISGTGPMYDYESTSDAPWFDQRDSIDTIIIGDGVTTIGANSFYNCHKMTSVTLSVSVTSIGDYAFSSCYGLTSVTIPKSVTTIGDSAFSGCNDLTSVVIPAGVISIGNKAFAFCDNLTEIYVDKDNPNYTSDDQGVLYDKQKKLLIQAPSLIGGTYVIPETVTIICECAFAGCESLNGVTIPDSVTTIGESAFASCDFLANLVIPDSVTSIGGYAFSWCEKLTTIRIPDGVASIENGTFRFCSKLSNVTIGNSVTRIGEDAFWACNSLTSVTIPDSVTMIDEDAFGGCEFTSVTIPDSITAIGAGAFRFCESMEEIIFTGDAPVIGNGVFIDVTATAYYPENNTTWTSDVMQDYGGDITWVSYVSDLGGACGDSVNWKLVGDNLTISGSGAMYNWSSEQDVPWYSHRGDITQVVLQSGVTSVGDRAFQGLAGVSALRIPDTVTYIGNSAFRDCTGLTGIALGNQVARIYSEAFANCTRLVEVTFPASVREIGSVAFSGCTRLQQVKFLGNAPGFGTNVFKNVKATAFYPAGNGSWSASVRQNYGGTITWASYDAADTPSVSAFTDVKPSDYFYEPVLWAVEQNITGGIGNGRFGPNQACTRGQIVTFLWAANGRPEPQSSENPFRDVKTSDYFYKAVLWAVEKGITSGVRPGQFGPGETCTRGQVATFLWAARGRPVPASASNSFSDVKSSDYYYSAVLWAVENGITGGVGKGRFGPGEICTRGQIVTFLYKAYA